MDVTTGQRKYGGPPPESVFSGTQPGIGTEVISSNKSFFLTYILSMLLNKNELMMHNALEQNQKWVIKQ